MPKSTIVENLGNALYRIKLSFNTDYATAQIEQLAQAIIDATQPTLDAQVKLAELEAETQQAGFDLDAALAEARANNEPLNGERVATALEALAKKNLERVQQRAETRRLENRKLFLQRQKQDLENKIAGLNNDGFFYAYCADYDDELEIGAAVETVMVPGENTGNQLVIYPNRYAKNLGASAYTGKTGALVPPWAMGPLPFFFNYAIKPGVQRWMPFFRYGVIKKINYFSHTCTVLINDEFSSIQDINGDNYPLHYFKINEIYPPEAKRLLDQIDDLKSEISILELKNDPALEDTINTKKGQLKDLRDARTKLLRDFTSNGNREKITEFKDIPINYMGCDSLAFKINDLIVVEFKPTINDLWSYSENRNLVWDTMTVIGFQYHPVECGVVNMESGTVTFNDFFPPDETPKQAGIVYHGPAETAEIASETALIGKLDFNGNDDDPILNTVKAAPFDSDALPGTTRHYRKNKDQYRLRERQVYEEQAKKDTVENVKKRLVMAFSFSYSGITGLAIQALLGAVRQASPVGVNNLGGIFYTVIGGNTLTHSEGLYIYSRVTGGGRYIFRAFMLAIGKNCYQSDVTFTREGLIVIQYLGTSAGQSLSNQKRQRLIAYALSQIESVGAQYWSGKGIEVHGSPLIHGWKFSNRTGAKLGLVTIETTYKENGAIDKRIGRLYQGQISFDESKLNENDNDTTPEFPLIYSFLKTRESDFMLPVQKLPLYVTDSIGNVSRVLKNGSNGFDAAAATGPYGSGPITCYFNNDDDLVVWEYYFDGKNETQSPEAKKYPCGADSVEDTMVTISGTVFNGGYKALNATFDAFLENAGGYVNEYYYKEVTSIYDQSDERFGRYYNAGVFQKSQYNNVCPPGDNYNIPKSDYGTIHKNYLLNKETERKNITYSDNSSACLIIPFGDENAVLVGTFENKSVTGSHFKWVAAVDNAGERDVWARKSDGTKGSGPKRLKYLIKNYGSSSTWQYSINDPNIRDITTKITFAVCHRSGHKITYEQEFNPDFLDGVQFYSLFFPRLDVDPAYRLELKTSVNGKVKCNFNTEYPATKGYDTGLDDGILTFSGFIGNG